MATIQARVLRRLRLATGPYQGLPVAAFHVAGNGLTVRQVGAALRRLHRSGKVRRIARDRYAGWLYAA